MSLDSTLFLVRNYFVILLINVHFNFSIWFGAHFQDQLSVPRRQNVNIRLKTYGYVTVCVLEEQSLYRGKCVRVDFLE